MVGDEQGFERQIDPFDGLGEEDVVLGEVGDDTLGSDGEQAGGVHDESWTVRAREGTMHQDEDGTALY